MQYRHLGNTGLAVSEIALGCEGFLKKDETSFAKLFHMALDAGVNFMDLYSPDPELHCRVGRAIRERDDFVLQLHLCTTWKGGQYQATREINEVKRSFEGALHNLDIDSAAIGMIHYVDAHSTWEAIQKGGILDYALSLKAQGVIKHIGLSSHNPQVALEAVESGAIEVLMFSVNPCYDLLPASEDVEALFAEESYKKPLFNIDPTRARLYETCLRRGVGITVMKAFGGGDLLTDHSPAGVALTAPQCIHYALTRPAVAAVMVGVHTQQELADALAYETASPSQRDYAEAFANFPKISWSGHCMYCGHCAPCPKRIDVATVTKFLNLARAQGEVPETVREHYRALDAYGGDCVACGACEKRCPFGVPIIQNMKAAKEMFGL